MSFALIDKVVECDARRVVAKMRLAPDAQHLRDHFEGFPIQPGVLMLESLVQAARELTRQRPGQPWVLGDVRALRFGAMLRPGDGLNVTVEVVGDEADRLSFKGEGLLDSDGTVAVSGKFSLRVLRP